MIIHALIDKIPLFSFEAISPSPQIPHKSQDTGEHLVGYLLSQSQIPSSHSRPKFLYYLVLSASCPALIDLNTEVRYHGKFLQSLSPTVDTNVLNNDHRVLINNTYYTTTPIALSYYMINYSETFKFLSKTHASLQPECT